MKFSKENLSRLRFISGAISLVGLGLIYTESFHLLSSILTTVGVLSFVLLTLKLNSFPLTDKEISEIKSIHDKGKSYFISRALYYGAFVLLIHIVMELIQSFWFNTPLSEHFKIRDIFTFFVLFVIAPIIGGYAIWKTNEETYRDYLAKEDKN